MIFQCIDIRQVPWEVLKTETGGLSFQHLPRDLANVNAWKTMFDRYIGKWDKVNCYATKCIKAVPVQIKFLFT